MSDTQITETEDTKRRRQIAHIASNPDNSSQTSSEPNSMPQQVARALLSSPTRRANAGLRAQAVQQMQRTHGNRSVQRQIATALNREVPVQREPSEDEEKPAPQNGEVRTARKGRTVASKILSAGRELTKAAVGRSTKAAKHEADAITATTEAARSGSIEEVIAGQHAQAHAGNARKLAESTTKSKLGRALEKHTGNTSAIGRGMRGANYGLQFVQNMSEGQDVGEAIFGAAGGGYTSNSMSRYLMSKSPRIGAVDMGVNLVNAVLQLGGAPEEVTTVTQTVADATPSSFGTSVVSNAGRGLWNTGKGIFTGDWSSLKEQGHDLTHGKGGAPLQGYATTVEALAAGISGDSEQLDKIREENRSGERGKLAQWGSRLGRWGRDTQDSTAEWIVDNVDLEAIANPLGIIGGNSGPSEEEQRKNQAEFVAKREKEVADLEKNKDQIMKEQGAEAYYRKMFMANSPAQIRALVQD